MVGTLQLSDYESIKDSVALAKKAAEFFVSEGCRIEIGHEHRWWEYGTAIELFQDFPVEEVLCVGSGADVLGPALALNFPVHVTECEPDKEFRDARARLNTLLVEAGCQPITVLDNNIHQLPEQEYDSVYCVSVIEHVLYERQAWEMLAKRVKVGGLLYVTTDCVPELGRQYHFDNLRTTNYTIDMLKERVQSLKGFSPLEEPPDWNWYGAHVFDYTFFRVVMVRVN